MDLSKVDIDSLTSAASASAGIGQQVGDVAELAENARKKHKSQPRHRVMAPGSAGQDWECR